MVSTGAAAGGLLRGSPAALPRACVLGVCGSELAFGQYLRGPALEGQKALGTLRLVAIARGCSLNLVPPPQTLFHPPRNSPATSLHEEASR